MNERIRELAKEAVKGIQTDFYIPDVFKEKFAELIVREAGALLMSPEFIGRSDLDWSMVLNEHFGVK